MNYNLTIKLIFMQELFKSPLFKTDNYSLVKAHYVI